jgi:hypothetical protein
VIYQLHYYIYEIVNLLPVGKTLLKTECRKGNFGRRIHN